ncbi:MAG: DNA (cytosine-5-)-methyltransferase [Phycisphaerales bacterium]|nr:DNA (cytosine-5-)-methyltransferase [Phycisphaerales bacterium]
MAPEQDNPSAPKAARRHFSVPQAVPEAERHGPEDEDGAGRRAVRSVDWASFRFIDLFAGIGGLRLGFESVGGRCVFSSEWDADAQTSYEANFGHRPAGDITAIDPAGIPAHDVLLAGFPCQPFSIIGDRKGFGDTRGTLFFNVEEILRAQRPAAVLLENVKQFKTHDEGRTYRTVVRSLASLGYFTHTAILNALHYGVAQRRERTFIVGLRADLPFRFPAPVERAATLEGVLEDDGAVDRKLWASEAIQRKRLERVRAQGQEPFYPSIWHENKGGHIGMHPYSCALRANASYNYLLVNGRRRPSGRENLRLQGFPDSYRIAVPYGAIRKQAGNSVAVPVIRAIAESMMRTLRGEAEAAAPVVVRSGEFTLR